jgi:hypothetical protein
MTVEHHQWPTEDAGNDSGEGDRRAASSYANDDRASRTVYHVNGNLYTGTVYYGDVGPRAPETADPTSREGGGESRPALHSPDYREINEALRRLRDEVEDESIFTAIKSSVEGLQGQVSAWIDQAVQEKDHRIQLYQQLQRAERKGRTQFWWGLGMAIPLGLIGSVIAWILGIN